MMERWIQISPTAFRRRSRPQIYTDETRIRRTRICPRNTQPSHTTAGRHGRTRKLNPSSSCIFFVSFRVFRGQPCSNRRTDLKLAPFPSRSPLPFAALPSISLIPPTRFADAEQTAGLPDLGCADMSPSGIRRDLSRGEF